MPNRESQEPDLTPDRLRAAFQHFLELAVAFEGGGVEVVVAEGAGAAAQDDPAALKCLSTVVSALEAHVEEQRQAQCDALAVVLHTDATALFDKLRDEPDSLDLEPAVRELAARHGLEAGEGLLDALVIAKHELQGGPSRVAALQIGELRGVSDRTVFKYRVQGKVAGLHRRAWGRWVPLGLCAKYAASALGETGAQEETKPELDRLDGGSAGVHRALDDRAGAEYRRQVVEMFEFVLLGDLDRVKDAERGALFEQILAQRNELRDLAREYVKTPRSQEGLDSDSATIETEIEAVMGKIARSLAEQALRDAGLR